MAWFREVNHGVQEFGRLTGELELLVPRRVWGPGIVLKEGILDISWS